MAQLGKKYTCYSCHTKFYDLGKPIPVCPKCGADQRDAEEAPVTTSHRSKRVAPAAVVEEPVEDSDFGGDSEAAPVAVSDEDEEILPEVEREEEPDDEEEEEEY